MNMQLTVEYLQRLRSELQNKPLDSNEVRRVQGMGEQYIALKTAQVDRSYKHLYDVTIDKMEYAIYARLATG